MEQFMKSFSISLHNSKTIQSKYGSVFAGCRWGSQRPATAFLKAPKTLKEETIVQIVKFFKIHPHVKLVLKSETGNYRNTSMKKHADGQEAELWNPLSAAYISPYQCVSKETTSGCARPNQANAKTALIILMTFQ